MPEIVDEKTGKRIFHENETTLKVQHTVEKKFESKGSFMPVSYTHLRAHET